jgi:hypothetical protein
VGQALVLMIGAVGVGLAMLAGRSDLLGAVLDPPRPANLLLGVAAVSLGVVVLLRAVERVGEAAGDARALIRGVRLVFLSVAAVAAAAGWFLDIPVAIVAALVIAGVDVLETTLLLLVTATRGDGQPGGGGQPEGGESDELAPGA